MQVFEADFLAGPAEKQRHWLHHFGTADSPHGRSNSMARLEQASGGEDANRFSHNRTANTELLRELAFGREPRSYSEASRNDLLFDGMYDAIDQAIFSANHFETGFRAPRDGSHVYGDCRVAAACLSTITW
jgi:hypothetical protein